jgi:putative ABC transport system substrate-binding protein
VRSRRAFLGVAVMGALAAPRAVAAQGRKVSRIGVLSPFEGENLAFEYRWADGKDERLPPLAAELAQSQVDVVLSAWSLARPGGNVRGSTFLSEETVGKLLQLLKEVVPRAARVATVFKPGNPVYGPMLKARVKAWNPAILTP